MREEYKVIRTWNGDNIEHIISHIEKKYGIATLAIAQDENRYYGFNQDGLMVCEAYLDGHRVVVFDTQKQLS